MSEKLSIVGLDKAVVFAALYNRARPQGMGFMHYDPTPMTAEQARKELGPGDDVKRVFGNDLHPGKLYFDYVKGRVMKIDISGDEVDVWGFDRDNGAGAAAEAIASLQVEGTPNGQVIQAGHHLGVQTAAQQVYDIFHEESTLEIGSGVPTLHLGLADHADQLLPRVRAVTEETAEDDNRR